MARGGARNRSGPQRDPKSGRSDSSGYSLTALPPAGYDGKVPEYPLPTMSVFATEYEGDRKFQVFDGKATASFRKRELELWESRWSDPQACAWSMEPWRWHTVAMWVRTAVVCEGSNATAADKGSLHRFADQIGLTPAGLKENGWKIADPAEASEAPEFDDGDDEDDPRNRLSVVRDGTGG